MEYLLYFTIIHVIQMHFNYDNFFQYFKAIKDFLIHNNCKRIHINQFKD